MSPYQRVNRIGAAPLGSAVFISSTSMLQSFTGRKVTTNSACGSSSAFQQSNEVLINFKTSHNAILRAYHNQKHSKQFNMIRRRLISKKNKIDKQNFADLAKDLSSKNTSSVLLKEIPKPRTTPTVSNAAEGEIGQAGFLGWYESHLKSMPITTKAFTGSALWGLGDSVGQIVPNIFQQHQEDKSQNMHKSVYDYPRTARAMLFGFGIHAPLSHLHFNFLEFMTIRCGFEGISIPVFKTIMEQLVYWSWFSNSLYHGAMGAMQGLNTNQIYDRIADVLWDTQKAQWAFWIPVQLLNFQLVPVRHQLNVVLVTSVAWTALLSAWYPPENNSDQTEIN